MPRNNGIYTPPPSTWNPAVDGQPADPESWNDLLADLAAALSQSVSKDGQTQITGDMNWGGNKITNLGLPTSAGDALRYSMITKGEDIASAATINIPVDGILFDVTGNTTISAFTGGFSGKFVFLRFAEELVIENSSSLLLPASSDYRTIAGEITLFIRVGTAWKMFASGSSHLVGDFLDTVRVLDNTWLRRNGALYDRTDYPVLADLLPPLPDGVIWSSEPSGTSGALGALLVTPDINLSASANGATIVASKNGGPWFAISVLDGFGITGLAHGAGIYAACDINQGRVFTSPDSEEWNQGAVLNASGLLSIEYGDGVGVFVTTGVNGSIHTSDDGASWVSRTSGTSADIQRVRWLNNRFVAVATGGQVLHSLDGENWNVSTISGASTLRGVWFYGGLYVVVGNSGLIYTSPNLTTWTQRTSGTSVTLNDVFGNEHGFIAVGDSGVVRIADVNAITWTAAPTGFNSSLRSIVQDPDNTFGYMVSGVPGQITEGIRTLPTQFRVPNDNPQYGWIKAL